MRVPTRLTVTLLLSVVASIGMTGCNTMRGAGKDIQRGGEAVEDAAANVQEDINTSKAQESKDVPSDLSRGIIGPAYASGIEYGKSEIFMITANTDYYAADVWLYGQSLGAASRRIVDNPTR